MYAYIYIYIYRWIYRGPVVEVRVPEVGAELADGHDQREPYYIITHNNLHIYQTTNIQYIYIYIYIYTYDYT